MTPELAKLDYRTPYEASEDYWRFRQLVRQTADDDGVMMLGDSVIWGEYVPANQALSATLNNALGHPLFVNGGINGMHPLAMTGLVGDYAGSLRRQAVFVHCNLLWQTSAERDLSTDADLSFNHPRLVPQFTWKIPGYHADISDRLSIVVERHVKLRQWVRHLWIKYLGGQDLPHWTLEHPYAWPTALPDADSAQTRQTSVPWTERGIRPQAYAWVPLTTSLQWQAFQQTIHTLQQRGNRVFVLIGPFNTHLLTAASLNEWRRRRAAIADWLDTTGVAYWCRIPCPRTCTRMRAILWPRATSSWPNSC